MRPSKAVRLRQSLLVLLQALRRIVDFTRTNDE
jgi:hypothetical protein